jgi:hypothetical protein
MAVACLAAGLMQAHGSPRHIIQAAYSALTLRPTAAARFHNTASEGCCVSGKLRRQAGLSDGGRHLSQNAASAASQPHMGD